MRKAQARFVALAAVALLVALVGLVACREQGPAPPNDQGGPGLVPHGNMGATIPTGPAFSWQYVNLEGQKATYGIQFGQQALINGVNFGITGSNTKIVRITRFKIGPSTATALGVQDIALQTFKSFPGDASNVFQGAISFANFDPDAGQPTAQELFYTSTPTGGQEIAALRAEQLISMPVATMTSTGNTIVWNFCGGAPESCVVLRGAGEAVLFRVQGGGALAGQKVDYEFDWTEE